MSSKDSENLNRSHRYLQTLRQHCVKEKHDSVLEIMAWTQEHFQKSLPQMQVKALSRKEEAICDHDPEMPVFSGPKLI